MSTGNGRRGQAVVESDIRWRVAIRPPCDKRSRGQALVEFALIVPVLVLILLITVDFGRLFFTYIQVNNAAREGASYGSLNPTSTGIATAAQKEIDAQAQRGESSISVSSTCADSTGNALACASAPGGSGRGNTITVAVSENFTFLTPLINGAFGNNFKIGASATAAVTGVAPGGGGTGQTCTTLPTASFSIVPANLTVNLDASASTPTSGYCAISGYNWDMGDSANPTPYPSFEGVTFSYTYPGPGPYTIQLLVTNQFGTAPASHTITLPSGNACQAPTAALHVTPTTGSKMNHGGQQGTTFTFDGSNSTNMSTSSCNPTWTVYFGDGQSATGTGVPPTNTTHKYADSVTSPVYATLKVTNTIGNNTSAQVQITLH